MPRHGHMGPGGTSEKAKDFKGNTQQTSSLHECL